MIPLLDYDGLYRHDLPDQKSILQAILRVAERNGDLTLLPTLSVALERVEAAIQLEHAWRVASTPTVDRQGAKDQDLQIEGLLGDISRALSAAADSKLHPHREAAAALHRECFPRGLRAHIREDFADKVEMTGVLVRHLRQPAHEALVAALWLQPTLDALDRLNESFRDGLVVDTPVTRAAVTAAAARALRATRRATWLVLGSFDPDDEAETLRRDEALAQLRSVESKLRERRTLGPRKKKAERVPPSTVEPRPGEPQG